jgi:hypothetical protein
VSSAGPTRAIPSDKPVGDHGGSLANGTCGQSWAGTPTITIGTARTSLASNDQPTVTTKRAFRWTCWLRGARCSVA